MKPIRRTTRVSVRGHGAWKIILPVGRLGKWWITTPKDPGNVVCPFRSWPNFMACFYGGDPNYLRLPGMMILLDRGGLLGRPGLVKISSCKLGPLGFHGFPRKKTLGFGGFFLVDFLWRIRSIPWDEHHHNITTIWYRNIFWNIFSKHLLQANLRTCFLYTIGSFSTGKGRCEAGFHHLFSQRFLERAHFHTTRIPFP